MKKWFTAALIAMGFLIGSTAFASDRMAVDQGTVRRLDPAGRSLTLTDGTVLEVPSSIATPALQPGDEVTVFYRPGQDGQNQLTAVWIDQGADGGNS
ncbi:MAG TPA: DUF1344 domain-containing protein [Candidatus Sulfotelmatobacter sp.]|nr:DUF1344 domain-containing protein [Candidatus Sulfotelmatobacter sp.]